MEQTNLFVGFGPHYSLSLRTCAPGAYRPLELPAVVHGTASFGSFTAGIPSGTYDVVTAQGLLFLMSGEGAESRVFALRREDLLDPAFSELRDSVRAHVWPLLSSRGVVAFVQHDLALVRRLRPFGVPVHGTDCPHCQFIGVEQDGERELDAYVCLPASGDASPRLVGRYLRGDEASVGFPLQALDVLPLGTPARAAYGALLRRMDYLTPEGVIQVPRPLRTPDALV